MVHATNNYSCPNVHTSSMNAPCVYYEVAMQLICSLISFFQTTLVLSRPMISHYMTSHVTTLTCLFIINKKKEIQKKRNIKSRKINKEKREVLVLICIITITSSFLVPFVLKTLNNLSIGLVFICSSFTGCL